GVDVWRAGVSGCCQLLYEVAVCVQATPGVVDLGQAGCKLPIEVVEDGHARVLIAPMAQMFLFGTQIDYEVSLLEAGFKFNNPNVTEACGCGESIKFEGM
ncbi:MAG: iron-sulfur cluster assembly accessory protein, partial [Pseudomonadota bacterium]